MSYQIRLLTTFAVVALVLTGTGICEVGDKSYPVAPGATFKIAPGVVHSMTATDGAVVVAVAYFEPPLVDVDDRVFVK